MLCCVAVVSTSLSLSTNISATQLVHDSQGVLFLRSTFCLCLLLYRNITSTSNSNFCRLVFLWLCTDGRMGANPSVVGVKYKTSATLKRRFYFSKCDFQFHEEVVMQKTFSECRKEFYLTNNLHT